jgi:hypothetical protein
MLKRLVFLSCIVLLTSSAFAEPASKCGVSPNLYPALNTVIENAAKEALAQHPNGRAGEITAAFKAGLLSELRKLSQPQKSAIVQALGSLGFSGLSDKQLATCFAGYALLSHERWGAKSSVSAPPEGCHGFFDTATYRALNEFLEEVMRLALQDASHGSGADLMKAFQSRLKEVEQTETPPLQVADAMSSLFDKLDDVSACIPALAPLQERRDREVAAPKHVQPPPSVAQNPITSTPVQPQPAPAGVAQPQSSSMENARTLRFPNAWAFYWSVFCVGPPVFQCDYTTKTCSQGHSGLNGQFVGVVLAEDRKTILAHIYCAPGGECFNLDNGEVTIRGRRVPQLDMRRDVPQSEVDRVRSSCSLH